MSQPQDDQAILAERISLEHCPTCGHQSLRPWRTLFGWPLSQCAACAMIFVNPMPTDRALQRAYSLPKEEYDAFFQTGYLNTEQILDGSATWQPGKVNRHLDCIEERKPQKGRILELGCGPGLFLEAAALRGWQTSGIDAGDWRKDPAMDARLGIRRCSLFEHPFADESFDVVYMASVLEHLSDPERYLQTILKLLKPKGLLYVSGLPNIHSWTIRIGIDQWIGNRPPMHLLYFSPKTAQLLMQRLGFNSVEVESYGVSETILSWLLTRKKERNNAPFSNQYLSSFEQTNWRGSLLRAIRKLGNRFYAATKSGSVLRVLAFK